MGQAGGSRNSGNHFESILPLIYPYSNLNRIVRYFIQLQIFIVELHQMIVELHQMIESALRASFHNENGKEMKKLN